MSPMPQINFIFYGTSEFSVFILDTLLKANFKPCLIVSTPDQAQGRKMEIKPTLTKIWAQNNQVPIFQPNKLDEEAFEFLQNFISQHRVDVAIVASYGKIIPERFLGLPPHQTLNAHPSLLPKYRGPAPIEYQILDDEKNIGVSVMLLDKEMDHGPILKQAQLGNSEIFNREILEQKLAELNARLLVEILPDWIENKITPQAQNHAEASYTKKINKQEAEISWQDLQQSNLARKNFLKIQAYYGWPNAWTLVEHNHKQIRLVIKTAELKNEKLEILTVIPEGKKEMNWLDFLRGLK